jgi:DNA-binding PadR family transcriptional regulator
MAWGHRWPEGGKESGVEAMSSASAATKTDLLLLGLLLDRPMHGYELYQQIQAEGIDEWYNVSAAGVYYSLRKLREQGLVSESRQQVGGGTRKSIYRQTEKGRTAFFETMETELASREKAYLDYDLVIYLMNRVPLRRAIPQLQQRQAWLAEQAGGLEATLAAMRDNGHSPSRLAILDHKRRFLEMERAWLDDVVQSIEANDVHAAVDQSGRKGMMVLSGELSHYHLPDLFRLIVSGQHSGTLRVSEGAKVQTLSFEQGQPVCGSYTRRGDSPDTSSSCDDVIENLCDLFRSQAGTFTFDQRMEPEEWCVPLECSAEDLMLRGCRKVDSWTIIQNLVPSADTIFEMGKAVAEVEHLALVPMERQVIAAVDGLKDVATIARECDLTLFEASRIFYCLTAIGVLRSADRDKTVLRRVFREIAELVCNSTLAWRSSPDDRSCEETVNAQVQHLPVCLNKGRIEDRADPQLGIEELREVYHRFLEEQFRVVSQYFGHANACQSYKQTLGQLAPELQGVAKRYGFDRIAKN